MVWVGCAARVRTKVKARAEARAKAGVGQHCLVNEGGIALEKALIKAALHAL